MRDLYQPGIIAKITEKLNSSSSAWRDAHHLSLREMEAAGDILMREGMAAAAGAKRHNKPSRLWVIPFY